MSDIIVFISPKFKDCDLQKIAESMRIHKITTTDDIRNATVVLEPVLYDTQSEPKNTSIIIATEPNKPTATLADIAEKIVDETRGQIFKLKENLMSDIPEVIAASMVLPKKSHHRKNMYPKQSLYNFKSINNIRNNRIFNRTNHK